MKNPLILSPEMNETLQEMENTSNHLFITGRGGTGKSTLLELFKNTTQKRVVFLAPTGIAALRIQGQTVHSFFRLPPKLIQPGTQSFKFNMGILKKVDIIVIDEISMVRADLLDAIDECLRIQMKTSKPFGGKRMILVGDLFQLPPVVSTQEEKYYFSTYYESPYFFSSNIWRQLSNVNFIELKKVYRQKDQSFIHLLDEIRMGIADFDTLDTINQQSKAKQSIEKTYVFLSPRNNAVQKLNTEKLTELDEIQLSFEAKITGQFPINLAPTELVLQLKKGTQVMFIRNDSDRKYVNGTIGVIQSIYEDHVEIKLDDGTVVDCKPQDWDIIKYKIDPADPSQITDEVIGTFTQLPIKLAWAVTIHKSQGQTFDHVVIDMGSGAFEHGQTYVALSRATSLEGIILTRPLEPKDIMVDPRVVAFHRQYF